MHHVTRIGTDDPPLPRRFQARSALHFSFAAWGRPVPLFTRRHRSPSNNKKARPPKRAGHRLSFNLRPRARLLVVDPSAHRASILLAADAARLPLGIVEYEGHAADRSATDRGDGVTVVGHPLHLSADIDVELEAEDHDERDHLPRPLAMASEKSNLLQQAWLSVALRRRLDGQTDEAPAILFFFRR